MTTTNQKKLSVAEVISVIRPYTEKDGNRTGGNLHMVLSNTNVNDSHIMFCLEQAEKNADTDGAELARLLLSLSKTQRLKACSNW